MFKSTVSWIMLTLLLALSLLTFAFNIEPVKSEPNAIIVPDDYPTIQEAINHADEGDTIFVYNGTYSEPQVTIDKPLQLIGENKSTTIIDGGGSWVCVYVDFTHNVKISGFTMQNGYGIYSYRSENVTISGNIISNNGQGIVILESTSNTVSKNIVTLNGAISIFLSGSNGNKICGNIVTLNSGDAIWLDNSHWNTISGNNVSRNGLGTSLGYHVYGIRLSYSKNNSIYHNYIIDNYEQASGWRSVNNTWDDDYPSGGNYWSDYTGVDMFSGPYQNDTGSDGIGDTPYVIDENNTDRYPLMQPYYGPVPEIVLSDKEIIPNPCHTSSIGFTATVENPTTTNIWFQIRSDFGEFGFVFSTCMEDVEIDGSRRLNITFVDPYDPRFDRLSCIRGDTIYMVDPYWFYDWPTDYVYGIATVYNNTMWPENALTGYLSEIFPPPPPAETVVRYITKAGSQLVVVVTNTTIFARDFDYPTLYFKSYGPTGEKGYINVIFPMVNTTAIKVFIDGVKLTPPPFPVITSNGTHYFIYFEFTLSTRIIGIQYFQKMAPPTEPTVTVLSPENKTYTTGLLPLIFTVNETTSWIGYSLDNQANVTIAGNATLASLSEGVHSITVYANDTAGNMDASETVYFTVSLPYGPTADFTVTPETANVGESVTFDASSSLSGFNGTHEMPISEYRWNFGDGNKTTTSNPIIYHSFSNSGIYYVTLTVYALGATPERDSTTHKVNVISAPVGGYALPIKAYTTEKPLTLYLALVAILTVSFTIAKRRKKQQN